MSDGKKIQQALQNVHLNLSMLTTLDERLARLRRRREAAAKKVDQAKAQLDQVLAEKNALTLAAREKEKEMAAAEAAINRRKEQLSEAKTNKEFQSLKEQIALDQERNNQLADETIEAIAAAEEFEEQVTAAKEEVTKAEKTAETFRASCDEEAKVIEDDTEQVRIDLKKAVENLPGDFRTLYDRAIEYHGRGGLVPVIDRGYCGHCRREIPPQFVVNLLKGEPYLCQTCGYLLFIPDDFYKP
ncbi:MAG: hypothetical protein J6S27_00015 [Thermoguttaceae bacterium]|nr:hypothetical protein [Thermoguttaceae bacterium]